ncbi:hypothetical protein J4402_04075 [Candidatus Pacearchaeota archaeon]|nr:hypothetical protein [Candidatus Pacearchaeota archaeon]
MDETKRAYSEAVKVLKKCETPHGFFAAFPGYDMVWARDSMITSLGASLLGKNFKKTFAASLKTLAKEQSEKGQIPNAVDKFVKRKHHVDFTSIDSTLWFIIGHYIYRQRYNDSKLFNSQKKNIKKAFTWLSYQDTTEDIMLEQLPTTDWQDAFPHRYGHTINTQALYYKALKLANKKKQAEKLKKRINEISDVSLWKEKFYLPWRWKNHNSYQEKGEWFDSLGNLLAVIFNVASKQQAKKILQHIQNEKIAKPFPIKTIYPPIKKGSKDWQDYFNDCGARTPYQYSNSGIWTYIGGFYILALIKQKKFSEAKSQLEKLAKANLQNPLFSEWLDGKTGKPNSLSKEGNQAWNAGMYILAYESLKKKKVLL